MNKNRLSVGQNNPYKYSSSKISKFNRTTKGRYKHKSAIRPSGTGVQGIFVEICGIDRSFYE